MNADRWAFSTLGSGELTLPEVAAIAQYFGISRLEIRALEGTGDLPTLLAGRKNPLTVPGCHVALLATVFRLVENSEADRADLLRWAELAEQNHVPLLRVFGGGTWGVALADEDFARAAATVAWWRREKQQRGWRVDIAVETHHAFSASPMILRLQEALPEPLPVVWDFHHTHRTAGESLEESWGNLRGCVRHVQVNDSVEEPWENLPYRLTLPGQGTMPVPALLAFLQTQDYSGLVSLEWERLWHPSLPPVQEALQAAVEAGWMSPV